MQKTAEEYQKDLLWQTALENFLPHRLRRKSHDLSASDLETDRWVSLRAS